MCRDLHVRSHDSPSFAACQGDLRGVLLRLLLRIGVGECGSRDHQQVSASRGRGVRGPGPGRRPPGDAGPIGPLAFFDPFEAPVTAQRA